MTIDHKKSKAPPRPVLPHEHLTPQIVPVAKPGRDAVQLQNSSRLPFPHEAPAFHSRLHKDLGRSVIPKIIQRSLLPHETTPSKGAPSTRPIKKGTALQPLMRPIQPPIQQTAPLPPNFNHFRPKPVIAAPVLSRSHSQMFRKQANSIQRYAEAVLDETATMANAATQRRLASGNPASLKNYGAVRYRVGVGPWSNLSGVSQQWEELSNPTTHAERAVIAQLCSAIGAAYTPDAPNSIGLALAAKNVQIQWLFTELQPCGECEAWLRKIDNNVAISVQYSWMLADSRGMSQQERTRAQKLYMNQYFNGAYKLDESEEVF